MRYASLLAKILAVFAIGVTPAHSASVSYFLNQSNVLPDGTNYLRVTVSDDGLVSPDWIYFTVEVLDPLLDLGGRNFGIQRFAFNSDVSPGNLVHKIGGLPSHWNVLLNSTVSGFGLFELIPGGTGRSRQSPTLSFHIDSRSFATDSIYSYILHARCPSGGGPDDAAPMTCIPAEGTSYFAAHVAGFRYPGEISSAYFGGDLLDGPRIVPVPPAAWLFGSALGILQAIRRRLE